MCTGDQIHWTLFRCLRNKCAVQFRLPTQLTIWKLLQTPIQTQTNFEKKSQPQVFFPPVSNLMAAYYPNDVYSAFNKDFQGRLPQLMVMYIWLAHSPSCPFSLSPLILFWKHCRPSVAGNELVRIIWIAFS